MVRAIRELPSQSLPSEAITDGLLDGLTCVTDRIGALLSIRADQAAE